MDSIFSTLLSLQHKLLSWLRFLSGFVPVQPYRTTYKGYVTKVSQVLQSCNYIIYVYTPLTVNPHGTQLKCPGALGEDGKSSQLIRHVSVCRQNDPTVLAQNGPQLLVMFLRLLSRLPYCVLSAIIIQYMISRYSCTYNGRTL